MPDRPREKNEVREHRRAGQPQLDPVTARRVYGEPIELDGVKIIPVAAVRRCGHQASAEESGKGGGCSCVSARPVGLVVIRDGRVEWKPTLDVNRVLLAAAGVLAVLVLRRRR